MPVAPRINDVSYATTINDAHHFYWQGSAFGEVGGSLFVAGAVFGEI